jgi:hypothetical protein
MGHSISLPIGSLPGVRRARDPSNCGRRAFGTTPRWCLAERQSLPRRRLCDPVDDRFRRALLARRLRVSDAPATVPSRSDFQQPGIRCRKAIPGPRCRYVCQDASPLHKFAPPPAPIYNRPSIPTKWWRTIGREAARPSDSFLSRLQLASFDHTGSATPDRPALRYAYSPLQP